MFNVKVKWVGDLAGPSIKIERGVKQGCPLSPLLFAICYDVLLRRLIAKPTVSPYAFADDLAASASSIGDIIWTLRTLIEFSRFSGLGLNIDKTSILTTLPPSARIINIMQIFGFRDIRFVTRAKYLGVWMGSDVTTYDIFEGAKNKFVDRVHKLAQILKPSSLNKRILIFNIYILPVFYYLAKFYIIPYKSIIIPLKNLIRKKVVPFGGSAFSYCHLISPRDRAGPFTPLRDLWATNITLLAQNFDFKPSQLSPTPQMGLYQPLANEIWSKEGDWDSLDINEHRAYGAFCYLEDFHPRNSHKLLDTSPLGEAKPKKIRTLLYSNLVLQGYWQERESTKKSFPTSLYNKLGRFIGVDEEVHRVPNPHFFIAQHVKITCRILNSNIWNLQLRLMHNALPTDARRAAVGMEVPIRKAHSPSDPLPSPSPFPCYLCGSGQDSSCHIFLECKVTRKAFEKVIQRTNCAQLTFSFRSTFLLFSASSNALPTAIVLAFHWSIWFQRSRYFCFLPTLLPEEKAVERITEHCLSSLPGLGSGRPQKTEYRKIIGLAEIPATKSINCFTDGSAKKNPSRAGSGVWISSSHTNFRTTIHLAIGLGEGDNNLGEMVALLVSLSLAHYYFDHTVNPIPFLIFSDSLGCINYLTSGWPSPTNQLISRRARTLYSKLARYSGFRIYWVRGHSGIKGNEIVDREAKKGADLKIQRPHVNFRMQFKCINDDIKLRLQLENSSHWKKLLKR